MATSSRNRILLLTQRPTLETEFKAGCSGARVQVIDAPDGNLLSTLLRRGVDLVAFDLELSNEIITAGIDALGEFRDVPVLGMGEANENWQKLLRGSPIEDHIPLPLEATTLQQKLIQLLERGRFLQGSDLVGQSLQMRQLRERILLIAPTPVSSILLTGESGAGKDLVAEALHRYSSRREQPFRPLNCGAIPENLLENELFGHEKGAFTDARAQHQGIFEQANGGTVFLDEIGEMSLAAQVRLLRVLEQREVTRIGGDTSLPIDLRIVAATNRDLQEAVAERAFRLDLYHRLKVVELAIPPLRRRSEDIPLLIERFIHEFAQGNKT
ncbi:MAG: sigma 54-interacting transcriptional regulator, partial [Candidatus Latescibacterota bacterium]